MTNVNIGTIEINNPKAELNIKTMPLEQIKTIFVSFLENDFILSKKETKNNKWGNFAKRMSGLTTPEITEHIVNSKEERANFDFRNLGINKA